MRHAQHSSINVGMIDFTDALKRSITPNNEKPLLPEKAVGYSGKQKRKGLAVTRAA